MAPANYYNAPSPANHDVSDPLAYYLDFSSRSRYPGGYGDQGLPYFTYRGKEYEAAHVLSLFALGHCERFRLSGCNESRDYVLKVARWLVDDQQPDGTWLFPFAKTEYGLPKGFCSAILQGYAISVLVRAMLIADDDTFRQPAIRALQIFERSVEKGGVASTIHGYTFFDEYPCRPPHHVLNGFIFAVFGFYDLKRTANVKQAADLWVACLESLENLLEHFDTGEWTLYNIGEGPANLASVKYHRLHVEQVRALYQITGNEVFQKYFERWSKYRLGNAVALRILNSKLRNTSYRNR